jgi:hypothetical protein
VVALAGVLKTDDLAGVRDSRASGCRGSGSLGASVGVEVGCPGGATAAAGGGPGGATTTVAATPEPPGHAGGGSGGTSVPLPNDWGYTSCPSGAGSNVVLPVDRYGPGGQQTGSKSVICPAAQTGSTPTPPPPPPPPPSAGEVWAEVPLPAAAPGVNPATAGITQLASWFWVEGGDGPVTVTVEMGAYTVTATADPVEYRWEFGDGTSAASANAGSEGEPSVAHTYTEKGTYTVGLAVQYAGSYTFDGPAGTGSASLGTYWQPEVATPYTVQEVRSVLVPSGGA